MPTTIIRQSQESVPFISSTGRSYVLRLIRTSIDGELASSLPLVVVEEGDEGRVVATYREPQPDACGLDVEFPDIRAFASWHHCVVLSFDSADAS